MAAGERRRSAAQALSDPRRRRALALFGLNLGIVALLVGVALVPGEAEGGAGAPSGPDAPRTAATPAGAVLEEPPAAPPPGVRNAPRPAPTPSGTPAPALAPRTVDRALDGRVRAQVSAAVTRARQKSGGRATASNVVVAVHAREVGREGELLSISAGRALRPASNMKLVTSAAALVLLGPGFEFTTGFESEAALEDGTLRGDLVVRAGGDPMYDPAAEGDVSGFLGPAVEALRSAGVRRIEGDLVLDEGDYLVPGPAPEWPSDDQWWQEYCARCAGFSANAGCLTAVVEATRPGRAAEVRVQPRSHGLQRHGAVTTRAARTALRIAVEARPPRVTVRGDLPADVPRWTARFAHPDPVELFGAALAGALSEGGVALAGELRRERGLPPARRLAELRTPLLPLLEPINTHSNNPVTDQLFLALGAAAGDGGDREGGARATRRALAELRVPTEGLVQVDGSGLSRANRVSARQISALLSAVVEPGDACAAAFVASLATAGQTGTLERRMREGPATGRVHAKTGWIRGVSALSGIAETAGGARLAFSILVAYPPAADGLNTSCWKPMQDAICAELVGFDA